MDFKDLRVESVNAKSPDYKIIEKMRREAFGDDDWLPAWRLLLASKIGGAAYRAFYTGGDLCGFSFGVEGKELIYLLYLVVSPQMRSKGMGKALLDWHKNASAGKAICLDIDDPLAEAADNDSRRRREKFYLNNGFYFSDGSGRYPIFRTEKNLNPAMFKKLMLKASLGAFWGRVCRD